MNNAAANPAHQDTKAFSILKKTKLWGELSMRKRGKGGELSMRKRTGKSKKARWPKKLGEEGQCFTKCRDVPWVLTTPAHQMSADLSVKYSCRNAQALNYKTP